MSLRRCSRAAAAAGFAVAVLQVAACGGEASHHEAPAHVENPPVEAELSTMTLTPKAVERLGIETTRIELREVRRTRTYGGELMAPPGRALQPTAPLTGVVVGDPPPPGTLLGQGRELFRLLPLSPDQDPVRLATEAEARLVAARAAADRAERLLEKGAGSERRRDDARAELAIAEATQASLRSQLEGLSESGLEPGAAAGGYTVSAPIRGRLLRVHVANRQTVLAGAPLYDIVSEDPLWVRVPVYGGDLRRIDASRKATLVALGDESEEPLSLDPVPAPPTANPDAATVDLYYRLPNPELRFHPGEKVRVTVDLGSAESALVVPYSAVLHDIHGGSWVYEVSAPQVFARRRVEVARVEGELAVLARGPAEGTEIVVVGTPELYGTEFGVGH